MKKRSLLALTLFASLVLTGCNIIPDFNIGGDGESSQTDSGTSSSSSSSQTTNAKLSSITVVDPKTEYFVDDAFVTPTVMAHYDDESSKDVSAEATFKGFNSGTPVENQKITVSYTENKVKKTVSYTVNIKAYPLAYITISDPVTSYYTGDTLTKPTVTAHYTNDSTKIVTGSASFTGYDLSTAGDQSVLVSYTEGSITKTTSYNITVQTLVLTSITLSNKKTEYFVGDDFEKPTVTAHYNSGSSKEVTSSATCSGYNLSVAGEYMVTVSYTEGGVNQTETYGISVEAVVLQSISVENPKTAYTKDDTFVKPTVTAHYNSGKTEDVTDEATCTGYNMSVEGNHTVTVSYTKGGVTKTTTYSITVSDITKTHLNYTYDDYMSHNAYSNMDNCPLSGNPKLLIIPVWFSDSSSFISASSKEKVRSDIQKVYLGTNEETGWRSVKTFYEEESKETMSLTGTVSGWYDTKTSYTNYGSSTSSTKSLVSSAVTWYFDTYNKSDSRKNYDTNGDGYMDGVMLIYAAPDKQQSGFGSYSNLWAYCFWTGQSSSTSSPNPNVFFWASYDFMYGSNTAVSGSSGKFYNGDTSHCNLDGHTFIHEMGHVLGLEDYYDYGDGNYSPAGGFSMQDYNVGGHDPYSVMAYGWADPYVPTKSMTITINDFQSSHDMILLANHPVTSVFDEYILLELYTPTGLNELDSIYQYDEYYPQGPNVPGIRLWHVDARLTRWTGSDWSTTLTTNATSSNVYHAMSNSYDEEEYGSVLGSSYYDYNILQLIRQDGGSYRPQYTLSSSSLFKQSSSFSMSSYSSQFKKGTSMNNGSALGWTFTVTLVSSTSATINLVKTA